jgi:ribonuclease J
MPSQNIFVSDIGRVIEIDEDGASFSPNPVPSGKILIDGSGIGDVGNIVLRDRKNLAENGIIIAVATINAEFGELLCGPEIISRGFVYVRENEELMNGARDAATNALIDALSKGAHEWGDLKAILKSAISKYIFNKTKRKPLVLPIIMDM